MNKLTVWSQSAPISFVLFIIIICSNIFSSSDFLVRVLVTSIFIISILVYWTMSKLLKLQNATIYSAVFIISIGAIIYFIAQFSSIGIINFLLYVICLLSQFFLFKIVYQTGFGRAVWLTILNNIIGALIFLAIIYFSGATLYKSINLDKKESVNLSEDLNNKIAPAFDPLELSKAKALFPKNFPLPSDDSVTYVIINEPTPSIQLKGGSAILFTIPENSEKVLADYTAALKSLGLNVYNRKADVLGEQIVVGDYGKNKTQETAMYEIGVSVNSLPSGESKVTLWINN